MIIIFDPSPPLIKWCIDKDGKRFESACEFGPNWSEQVLAEISDLEKLTAIAYIVDHGGDAIKEPVSILTQTKLENLARSIPFLPEHNNLIYKVAQFWFNKFPGILQVLFCETAFFTNLPDKSSTYAIPYELSSKGIKRYGGYGLLHQWAWVQSRNVLIPPPTNLISIYLNNHINVTGIKDGQPVETTIGFTPIEGLPSAGSSGISIRRLFFSLIQPGCLLRKLMNY